jgi:hypothetical protein
MSNASNQAAAQLDDNIIRTRGPEHVRSLAARTLPDLRATSGGDTVESQKRSHLEQLSTTTYTYGSESVDAPTVNQNLFQQAHNIALRRPKTSRPNHGLPVPRNTNLVLITSTHSRKNI